MFPIRFVLVELATFSLLLASASAAIAADGQVNGLVTMRGKPITGRITFHVDDQFVGARVKLDGTFKVHRVLVGKYKVTIEGKGVPEKFASEDITPLAVEVKEGANTFDLDLQ